LGLDPPLDAGFVFEERHGQTPSLAGTRLEPFTLKLLIAVSMPPGVEQY